MSRQHVLSYPPKAWTPDHQASPTDPLASPTVRLAVSRHFNAELDARRDKDSRRGWHDQRDGERPDESPAPSV